MIFNNKQDHARAREFSRHEKEILEVRNRARKWRLADCDEETLNRMRHSLLDEMEDVEKQMKSADTYFSQCIDVGDPIATEDAVQRLNRVAAEWQAHNEHLQKIDNAVLERQLRTRLVKHVFKTEKRLNYFDSFIFATIVIVILMTIGEFVWLAIDPNYQNPLLVAIDTVICLVLLADFGMRWWLSEDRSWYFRNYWVDFVSSIPLVGILRVGRLVRLARFARLLRLFRLGRAMRSLQFLVRGADTLGETLQINILRRSFLFGLVMLFIGAYAIYSVELQGFVDPADGLSESFWWSFTTVITGGYADLHNPTTDFGRLITGLLVLVGLVIVSIFTASLTSVLVEDTSEPVERALSQLEGQLESVTQRLDLLSTETNQGLQVLETVAQQLSNQQSVEGLARLITKTMMDSFEAIQASFHQYNPQAERLERVSSVGLAMVTPAKAIRLGEMFLGRVSSDILQEDLAIFDVEPIDAPCVPVKGTSVACPLVAQGRYLGVMHLVLPSHLGRFYLYNRAPMTLAHHAAIALYAIQLEGTNTADPLLSENFH